jgi:ubiquinone/menaquinone biosynthesis C-methylase UbiE
MEAALQRRIQRYGWDKAATSYEDFWARQIAPAQEKLLEMAALRAGEDVVDIACGTGLVTMRAAEAVGAGGSVTAADLSDQMVLRAREEASARGIHNATFARMDAERLELEDGCCDAALCSLGLMYVPDPAAALRGMHRVLRAGGRAVAAVWGERRKCGWAGIFPVVDARVRTDVCPMFFQLGTGSALAETFALSGFEQIRTERMETIMRYESGEEACGAAFAGGPVALAHSRFDAETRDEAHREYLESIAAYRNGHGYRIPGEFVVVSGRKINR